MSENNQAPIKWVSYDLKKLAVGSQVQMVFDTSAVSQEILNEVRFEATLDHLTQLDDHTLLMIFGREGVDQLLGAIVQTDNNKLLDREAGEVFLPALQEIAKGLVFYVLAQAPSLQVTESLPADQGDTKPAWVFLQRQQLKAGMQVVYWQDLLENNETRQVELNEDPVHIFANGSKLYIFEQRVTQKYYAILVNANNVQLVGDQIEPYAQEIASLFPQPAVKPKYAIAIPAWQRFVSRDQWTPKLLDRNGPKDFCEKDPSHLQLLVYIAIKDPQGHIFSYKRGSQGTEDRLHDLRSIGLGGHADEPMKEGQDLTSYLAEHAVRETEEEVGWTPDFETMKQAIDKAFLIYMPKNDVDKVHMALAVTLEVPDRSVLVKLEEGQIEEPAWLDPAYAQLQLTLASLLKPEALAWKFETWSEVYLMVTRSPADEHRYRKQLNDLQMSFTMHRHAKQLFEQKVDPQIKGNPRLRIAVDKGIFMEFDLHGDDQWKRVENGPFNTMINVVRDGELPGGDPTAPRLRAYTFFSELTQVGHTTVDFIHWNQVDFNAPQVGDLQAQNESA